jgi:heme-degrading monooxygenase HmoA
MTFSFLQRYFFFLSCLLFSPSVQAFVVVDTSSVTNAAAARTSFPPLDPLEQQQRSAWNTKNPRTIKSSGLKAVSVDAVATELEEDTELAPNGLIKRDCYIATNRFAVRPNQQAVFEKRWATRKSRLAVLQGFRHFHLMRRVNLADSSYDGGDESNEAAQENYVSFTIWDKKSDFSAWRKGDAFKEAHGGTSIVSFLSTMVNSALVLRGAPRPAFYDGLCLNYQKPTYLPDPVDGWRSVQADGVNTLPAECFVQMVKYFVPSEQARTFETTWKASDISPGKGDGVIASSLMRRDGQAKGYVPITHLLSCARK